MLLPVFDLVNCSWNLLGNDEKFPYFHFKQPYLSTDEQKSGFSGWSCESVAHIHSVILTTRKGHKVYVFLHPVKGGHGPHGLTCKPIFYCSSAESNQTYFYFSESHKGGRNFCFVKKYLYNYQNHNINELINDIYYCNVNLWYRLCRINSGEISVFSSHRST